jgi:hypothetical protein
MTDMKDRETLERRARAALEARSRALEPDVQRRLDQARREALAVARRSGRSRSWAWPALAAAGAAAALVVAVVLQTDEPTVPSAPQTADLDLLTRDDFELLTEDPEFFAWIASQDEPAESAPTEDSSESKEQSG